MLRHKRKRRRRLLVEPLEARRLLAVNWRNPADALDVDADGFVVAGDALSIINDLNTTGSRTLNTPHPSTAPFLDVTGDGSSAADDALTIINVINSGQLTLGQRILREGSQLATAADVTITVGQASGVRTYRAQLNAVFDSTDTSSALEDTLAVYLIDPEAPSQTLLDQGINGTAVFTLTGDQASYTPGQVRWDGSILSIDVSAVTGEDTGLLRFQLLQSDGDVGTSIGITPLDNRVDLFGSSASLLFSSESAIAAGGSVNTSVLPVASGVETQFQNVSYNQATGRYSAELQLLNTGEPLRETVVVTLPNLPAGVSVVSPSGVTATGVPYFNFSPAIDGGLRSGALSRAVRVELDDPGNTAFRWQPQVLGQPNRPPVLSPIGPLNVMPGDVLRVPLQATDADGDALTFSVSGLEDLPSGMLQSDGTLVFRPAPNQIGAYEFDVVASDGALEATQHVTLNVIADPITTTRFSGQILKTNGQPLSGLRVEVGNVSGLTSADGSFLLDVGAGPVVSDTLKIRGELVTGAAKYPFIAEKLAFILEHPIYASYRNVIDRPIYLPALDIENAETIDPQQDITVDTPAIPGTSIFVQAGTLMNQQGTQFTGDLGITAVPTDLTPAAIPDDLFPDLLVTIQPGEMVFATPAPMTFPNSAGWAPGTLMDLWSINPVTGEFDDVGDMRVSADGATIETITGGVRNSSWHFPAPPPPEILTPPAQDSKNRTTAAKETTGCATATSECELHSGGVIEMHDLVTYQSLGVERALSLVYDSLRADPRPIVHFSVNNTQSDAALRMVATLNVSRGTFNLQVPGHAGGEFGLVGGEHIWSLPPNGEFGAALQVDLRDQPSGEYDYDINLGRRRFNGTMFSGSSQREAGSLLHVNAIDSQFGSGWGLAGLGQLIENPNGTVLWIDGDGSELLFEAPATAGQPYVAPAGDFSVLEKLGNGTFRRTTKEQTVFTFDAGNRLASMRDRNGNTTTFSYNGAGRLTKITDPVGLETNLTVGAGGRITSITDPMGRVTQLFYDVRGNLVRITDPDNTARNFEYDADHHLTAEVNKRGHREELSYDFAGRVTQALRKDGTVMQYQPTQVRGLRRPKETIDPLAPPAATAVGVTETIVLDANGDITRIILDQSGQQVGSSDDIGPLEQTRHNAQNLLSQTIDSRGNATTYRYDSRGNLLSIRDEITAPSVYLMPGFSGRGEVVAALEAAGFLVTVGEPSSSFTGPQSVLDPFDAVLMMSGGFMTDEGQTALVSYVNAGGALVTAEPLAQDIAAFQSFTILAPIVPATFESLQPPTTVTFTETTADAIVSAAIPDSFTFSLSTNFSGTNARLTAKQGATVFYASSAGGAGLVGWNVAAGRVASLSTSLTAAEVGDHDLRQLLGNVVEWAAKDPGPSYSSFTYDSAFSQPTSQTDGDGRRQVFDIDPANGNTRSITEVVGALGGADDVVTTLTHTPQGLIDTATDALGRITDFDYDSRGRLIKMTQAKGTVDEGVTQYEYDNAGNRIAMIDALGNRTAYQYDSHNRLLRATEADPDGAGELTAPVTTWAYDAQGNLVTQTDPLAKVTRIQYDAMNRRTQVTDALGGVSKWEYDGVGNVTSSTDEIGQITRLQYDVRDRLIASFDPAGFFTSYTYDQADNLIRVVDSRGNVTAYEYDQRNRKTKETDPLDKFMTYQYDHADNLIVKIDRNNKKTELFYDDLNRLRQEKWGNTVNYTYDKVGNMLSAIDFFSTQIFTFDSRNRMKTVDNTGTQQAPSVQLAYTYDAVGNPLTVADTINGTAGGVNTYAYDRLNRRTSATQAGAGVSGKRVNLEYDARDQVTAISRFSDIAGTQPVTRTQHTYDALRRVANIAHKQGTQTTAFEDVVYDAASRITRITDQQGSSVYQYAHNDQLKAADHTRAGLADETYAYDGVGNRTSSSLPGSAYQTGPGNRLLSDGTYNYQYDNEGNMIRRTEIATGKFTTFLYDTRNRVQLVRNRDAADTLLSQTVFTYDVFNRRIFRSEDTNLQVPGETLVEHFVYDRENVLLDFLDPDGNGPSFPAPPALSRRYLHGPAVDMVLAQDHGGGNVSWLLADHLGTTTDLIDNSGAVQKHFAYDSFGNLRSVTDGAGAAASAGADPTTRYLFTGREFNRDSGLYYYRARYYDPSIGRFLREDPLGFAGGDVNLYRYVGNDPLRFKDPTGMAINEVRVVGICGDQEFAEYRKKGSDEWLPLTKNTVLQQGDEISAGPEASVTVAFADNSTTTIPAGFNVNVSSYFTEGGIIRTEMFIRNAQAYEEAVRSGKIVPYEAPRSDFRIKQPTATTSVRG